MKNQNVKDLVLKLRQQFSENNVNIPDELKTLKAWLVWETTQLQPSGKFNKIPFCPITGRPRSGEQGLTEDLANLGTWADAVAAMENSRYAGVGFACLPCFGIVALDLDHCIKDDELDPKWAWVLSETYCEVSPSGTGLRAFWMGGARNGKNHEAGVELFHSTGFVTVTGDYYEGGVVRPLSDSLRARLEQLSTSKSSSSNSSLDLVNPKLSIPERLAQNAKSDLKLKAIIDAGLYERDIGNGKHSIKCPFESEHSDFGRAGGDADTVYFQANTNGYSEGHIHCLHTHPNDPTSYWKKLGLDISHDGQMMPLTIDEKTGEFVPVDLLIPVSLKDMLTNPPAPPTFVWDGLVPRGEVTLLSGHGEAGKTFIGLMLAISVSLGRPMFGIAVERSRAVFVSLEDDGDKIRWRISLICKVWDIDPLDLEGWLTVLDGTEYPEMYVALNKWATGEATATYAQLLQRVVDIDAGFVVIDNASDAYAGDENTRTMVRSFLRSLKQIAKASNGGVVLLSHVNRETAKGGFNDREGYSGNTAWHNSARSRLFLKKDKQTGLLNLSQEKSNHGKSLAEPIDLEWLTDELPKVVGDESNGKSLQLVGSSDDKKASVILALIDEYASRKQYCSVNPASHSNVFKLLRSDKEFKKLNLRLDDTRRVITHCQRNGWIEVQEYKDISRNKKERWVVTTLGKSFAGLKGSALNALNASYQSFNATDGMDAPASNIVGGMGDLRTHRN
jgi:KaiC/GvpD/RAD55 family RecA-like ATPase